MRPQARQFSVEIKSRKRPTSPAIAASAAARQDDWVDLIPPDDVPERDVHEDLADPSVQSEAKSGQSSLSATLVSLPGHCRSRVLMMSATRCRAASPSGRIGRGGLARQMPSRSALAYMTRKLENSVNKPQSGCKRLFSRRASATFPSRTARTRAMLVCGNRPATTLYHVSPPAISASTHCQSTL